MGPRGGRGKRTTDRLAVRLGWTGLAAPLAAIWNAFGAVRGELASMLAGPVACRTPAAADRHRVGD